MSIPDFRQLYEQLNRYQGEGPFHEVLLPWQDQAAEAMSPLRVYGEEWTRYLPNENLMEDLWSLYALSRVSDTLLLPFQKPCLDENSWRGPNISREERDEYLSSLGMHPIERKAFHPFFHEIVEVKQSPDPSEPITLESIIWSGFMLGRLVFCRAGVKVRGGRQHIKKEIAEAFTLYFTYRRNNRPVSDLSHGWGSNSQWRTQFRRDYEDDTSFYYNVDGELDVTLPATTGLINPSREELTADERVELLVNRCFILTEKPHRDLWPFGDTYTESKT